MVPVEYKFICAECKKKWLDNLLVPVCDYIGQDMISHRTGWSNLYSPDGGLSLTTTSQYLFVDTTVRSDVQPQN